MSERARALRTLELSRSLLDELGRPTGRSNAPVSIHYYFALLYHGSVTRNLELAERSRAGMLLYPLISTFYDHYFDSVIRRVRGEPVYRATPLWDRYFRMAEALDRSRIWLGLPPLIYVAARAHIRGDLAEALASVFATTDDAELVETAAADLFGAQSHALYLAALDDFALALGNAPHVPARPLPAALFRLSNRMLRGTIVDRMQGWRREAFAEARAALVAAPPKLPVVLAA